MRKTIALLGALSCAMPAFAASWVVDPITSHLTFEGDQAGEKFKGSFGKFTSTIHFDEATPEKGTIAITVDMASVQIDDKDRMDSLPTEDWFSVKQFPTAQFKSTSIKSLGADQAGTHAYEAKGNLTIRGIAKEITLPFSLVTTGKSAIARGNVTLNRSDYSVGIGQWKTEQWVKFPVAVHFELHATKSK